MNIPIDIFESLYKDHYNKLRRISYNILKSEHAAEDIAQDTFLRLSKQDYSKIEDHVVAWLFLVCRNSSLKYIRKNKRNVPLLDHDNDKIDEIRGPEDELIFKERCSELKVALAKLTNRQRDVIICRFYKDLNYEETTKNLKISAGNIGFTQSSAVKVLRKLMTT
jgi:RNA polymerase sigma-70 factor (ECF subfamily)